LKIKETEQTRLIENRDQLLRNYETMLKKEKEEKEKLKRDMESYQQQFLKITSSPHRSQREEQKWKLSEDLAKMVKPCYIKLNRIDEISIKHDETLTTADENTNPSAHGSLDIKHTLNSQSKSVVNNPAHKRKGSGCSGHTKKWCCEGNRATNMEHTPSASSACESPMLRNTPHSKCY
jgi:hypothetical protein